MSIDFSQIAPLPKTSRIERELGVLRKNLSKKDRKKFAKDAQEFLQKVPKAELHLHSTAMADILTTSKIAWDISKKTDQGLQNIKRYKGSRESLVKDFLNPKSRSLAAYLERYDMLKNYIIRDLNAIRQISYTGAKQACENGVRILEIRTSIKAGDYGDPRSQSIMSDIQYSAFEELCAWIDGFRKAEKESKNKLSVFLIICIRRQDTTKRSMALLNEILSYRKKIRQKYGHDYIVGLDIAGQEYLYKARKFEPVFRRARDEGLKVTAHAGEEQGSGEGSIWQAINSGAQRIGHGTSLYLPTPMLPEAVRHEAKGLKKNAFILSLMFGTSYEMCLTSNVVCSSEITLNYKSNPQGRPIAVKKAMTSPDEYPAQMIIALGSLYYQGRSNILPIPCTDGIYTLNTNLTREYALAAKTFGWGVKEVLGIARYSIRHSFAPREVKAQALKDWREFASIYLNDPLYSSPDEEAKKALHAYRQKVRRDLGVSSTMIEEIIQEVHTSKKYLRGYLYELFHEQNEQLEV